MKIDFATIPEIKKKKRRNQNNDFEVLEDK